MICIKNRYTGQKNMEDGHVKDDVHMLDSQGGTMFSMPPLVPCNNYLVVWLALRRIPEEPRMKDRSLATLPPLIMLPIGV